MQMWVYEEAEQEGEEANIFVHHDILLPTFPLAVAWLDCGPSHRSQPGNYAAVGSMGTGSFFY